MLTYVKRSNACFQTLKTSKAFRISLILFIYLALAGLYSIATPIGRGADEWAHYWYAEFIAAHGRLPANPIERKTAGYKSDWPPLYHFCAAAVTGWIKTAGPPTFKYRADNIRRQLIPAQGPDAILHTEDELFPWQQEILVWRLGRFLSIGFALGALLVVYHIALEVFRAAKDAQQRAQSEGYSITKPPRGGRSVGANREKFSESTKAKKNFPHFTPEILALVSVAVLAFIPRFLFTSMVFGYDSLTLLLASLFLWVAIRIARGYYSRWSFGILGALAGLTLMTKYLAALLPLEIVLLAALRREENRLKPLLQAVLAYLLVIGWWFGYLLINFNEIDDYGPILGTLAPLIRGDGSDRTVEQIFAWMSGGQAPPSAPIDQQSYTSWQIVTEFFTTFWGNPVTRPYPLDWFVGLMTGAAIITIAGLVLPRLSFASRSIKLKFDTPGSPLFRIVLLLLLHCLLPVPFMLIRLFGARDALEAVQGRHLLFLSGPAVVILLVWGIVNVTPYIHRFTSRFSFASRSRLPFFALLGLLLIGDIGQLIYMRQIYPPPLPARATPYPIESRSEQTTQLLSAISLPGGSRPIDYQLDLVESEPPCLFCLAHFAPAALKVVFIWQGGATPSPQDYRLELALVDAKGQTQANWLAYQTQARYPTRAWETGDIIRDEGWLPLTDLPSGIYEIRWRLLEENDPFLDWQTLTTYSLTEAVARPVASDWLLWRDGLIPLQPPLMRERETVQLTISTASAPPQLVGPDGIARSPASIGSTWANFIIGPDWTPGDYHLVGAKDASPLLRVAENGRNFRLPAPTHPLEVNFENQIELLGYDLPTRRVQPGEGLPITLYWQGVRWMGEDFVIFERLLDNQGLAWGGYDRRTKENDSTLFWAPGQVIDDGFAAPVNPDTPDGVYRLSLGWYRRVDGEAKSLSILDPVSGQPTDTTAVTIGPIKVGGPPLGVTVAVAAPQTKVDVVLGGQIKLLGFDLTNEQIGESKSNASTSTRSTSSLRLTLYWQALVPTEIDYTVFAHVRAAAGKVVAQKDAPPVGGVYPTGLWDPGEIIKDELTIPLENLSPGQYELVIGLYDLVSGNRLAVPASADNAIELYSFEIGE